MLQRQDLLLQLETLLTCTTIATPKKIETLLSKVRTLTLTLVQSVVIWRSSSSSSEKSMISSSEFKHDSDSCPVPFVWEGQNILLRLRRDTASVVLALNHSVGGEEYIVSGNPFFMKTKRRRSVSRSSSEDIQLQLALRVLEVEAKTVENSRMELCFDQGKPV